MYQATANGEFSDPLSYSEVMKRSDKELWMKAMQEEYEALIGNKTWDLVEIPADRKPVKSKWVFKTKRDEKGNVQRYKARLVAKGCSQRKGIVCGTRN